MFKNYCTFLWECDILLQRNSEKPTPLGVRWIAFGSIMYVIVDFVHNYDILYVWKINTGIQILRYH